ncbi:GNAT family N-acetyltransferase [Pirellulaceae bacterium SH449]
MYSLLRRVGIADFSLLMCSNVEHLAASGQKLPDGIELIELSVESFDILSQCNPLFQFEAFQYLDRKRFRCYVLMASEAIVAYAWVGTGEIPAAHNSNGHAWTGLPLFLDPRTAYLFAAFVNPEHRGKRLYQVLISQTAKILRADGILRIALTTDANNARAILAVKRMGFEVCGITTFCALVGWKRASYCVSSSFEPSKVGQYVGDFRTR